MTPHGDILLVSCYELGHQPLGLALPLAFLARAGFAPEALDLAVEKLDPARIARARFVAVSVPMHTAMRIGVRFAERVRAICPDAAICFFGHYAVLNADYLLARVADAVIGGEVEEALVALVHATESGDPAPIAGVRRRGDPPGPARAVLARLDFPVPSRAALPKLERYARLDVDGDLRLAGHVEASRGCLHLCRHCPIPPVYDGRFFIVPADVVLADARAQVAAGARHITFGDPDFLNGPGHSLRIVRALHAEFPALTFDATAKVEHLLRHAALLPELAACGCAFLVTAAESLSDTVLAHLDKGHTRADLERVLELARAAGIPVRPTWVPFTPWTTRADYLELVRFIEEEDLVDRVDPVQLAIRLLVPPGSWLLDSPAMRPHLGPLVEETLIHRWTHPDPRMDELHREVLGIVEAGERAGADAGDTFDHIRHLVGREGRSARPRRERAPRLTESWFC